MNTKLVKELIDDGYWFLNFEFINNSDNITDDDLKNSIYESIKYLNKLYEDTKDYNKVHTHLIEKYKYKMAE